MNLEHKIEIQRFIFFFFSAVAEKFLGNERAENYLELIDELVDAYDDIGALMSLKMHILWSHPDKFPYNCGAEGDEEGERQHQVLKPFEKRYSNPTPQMLARFCWDQLRETPQIQKRSRNCR